MASYCTITLPTVSGTHSDLPLLLTNGAFPSAAIDGGGTSIDNGGGNLRAYTDDTKATQIPIEVVSFVTGVSPDIQVWVKLPSVFTGATIYLEADDSESAQPAVTATYGRNAVNSVPTYHRGNGVDSAGIADLAVNTTTEVDAFIGQGISTNGDKQTTDNSNLEFYLNDSDYTIGGWIELEDIANQPAYCTIFRIGDDYSIRRNNTNNNQLRVYHSGSYAQDSDLLSKIEGTTAHLKIVWDQSTVYFYINGQYESAVSRNQDPHESGVSTVNFGYNMEGILSHWSVAKVRRSSEYIETEYNNQANTDWFTVGTWETEVSEDQTVTLVNISSTLQFHSPQVLKAKLINLDHIGTTTLVEDPTVRLQKKIDLSYITPTTSVYEPTLGQVKLISLDHIDSSTSVYNPTLRLQNKVTLGTLSSTLDVYEPTVSRNLLLQPTTITSTFSMDEPTVKKHKKIELDNIDSTTIVYDPIILNEKLIQLEPIDAFSFVYSPIVTGGAIVITTSASFRLHIQWREFDRL